VVAGAGDSGVELDAHVVWVRGDSVYLAAHDSIAVEPATHLTFLSKGKTIAEGEVSEVLDRAVARAHLTSGGIRDTKHLDRVRVLAQPPPMRRRLRVGYPDSARADGPYLCPPTTVSADTTSRRFERVGRTLRITRRDSLPSSPWPDTLIVQPFADAADQEIALERGEIDVGVFRAGELSAHMREHPRYRDPLGWAPPTPYQEYPVVCDPAVRTQVAAIGARAFVVLFCPGGGPR